MSDHRDPATDQPEPEVNDRAFVQDLVVADIEVRKEFGIRKYGTALQSGNGRDMLQDAYEEALDLAIYLRGMKDEDHHIEIDLQRVRKERNWLINEMQRLAAPILFTSTGTVASAAYNVETYVRRLEAVLAAARDHFDDHCPSHAEFEESCSTCSMVLALKEMGT